MATKVVMPALEMAQETGKLVAWLKQEGDAVRKGELLMEVETDKAVVEIEAPADGVLAGVRAREGDEFAVGDAIAWIVAPGEQPPTGTDPIRTGREAVHRQTHGTAAPVPRAAEPASRPLMSPKARRLAGERGLNVPAGSGPGGAVIAADIDAARADVLPATWRLMAERMSASWSTVPHFFLTREIDAASLVSVRERLNAASPTPAITVSDLVVALAARALRKHPAVNASWTDGRVEKHAAINIGIAVGVEDGVVAPVIRDADRLEIAVLAQRRSALVERARAGRLQPSDLGGGTFTISNLGMYGIDTFSAIVNAPQAAILAVGRVADRVVARDGHPAVRPTVNVTLSSDHRVLDGVRAAAFLADVASLIEEAERSVS